MTTPESVEVNAVAVIRRNHRQAGKPAFGRFRLLYDRQSTSRGKIK
jgi:hypothetical protein